MLFSNIFLVLPVIFSVIYHQWLYCFLASGLLIFSPLYHLFRIIKHNSLCFNIFKKLDWLFAVMAFIYMYYYVYMFVLNYKLLFYILLSFVLVYFWYGYKKGDYNKTHPWFHIIAPIISLAILVSAHISIIS